MEGGNAIRPSGSREQPPRPGLVATEPHGPRGRVPPSPDFLSLRGATPDPPVQFCLCVKPERLGQFSERIVDLASGDPWVPLAALATSLAAAQSPDCYLRLYWCHPGSSALRYFVRHALSAEWAV